MATINEVRAEFRRVSGRDDLSTALIDGYLNKGQRYLDQLTQYQKAPTRLQSSLVAGQIYTVFSARMRVIHEVWIAQSGEQKWQLGKMSSVLYRETYPKPPSSMDTGSPLHYTPDSLNYFNASGDFQYYPGAYSDSFTKNGILIGPPADQAYEVEVLGRFFSPVISDSQSSWWLEQQSDLVLLAAMRMLETEYRNTQGTRDWDLSLAAMLKAVQDDDVEEDSVTINLMEG